MKILYYTSPSFLEASFHRIKILSRLAELHVIVELPPEAHHVNIMNVPSGKRFSRLMEPWDAVANCFPPGVGAYWKDAAHIELAVYTQKKSVHPAAWIDSFRVASRIKKIKPDLIFLEDIFLRFAWNAWRLRSIPMVAAIHDPVPHSGEKNWRKELAHRLVLSQVSHVLLMNSRLTQAFSKRCKFPRDRISVVPLGPYAIFREWIKTPVPQAPKTVLFFGRLSKYKGIDVLYKAAPLVAEKVPGVCFVIAGRPVPGYEPPVVPDLPNNGRIDVLDRYIDNEEMADLFQRARVVACPYIDATQSGVLFTAYGFDRPVVCTAVGGLPEYMRDGETGLLVPPYDSRALADALNRILTNDWAQRDRGEGETESTPRIMNWDEIGDKMMTLFHRAISSRQENV